MDKQSIAKYIDHTLLKPNAQKEDIKKLCREAAEYNFASVCVNPYYVPLAKKELSNSEVKVCTVVGFPLGADKPKVKIKETKKLLEDGADEIDMVINIGALKDKDYDMVLDEISQIKKLCGDRILKVIIETSYLSDEEKIKACELCVKANADFVKTSTGFSDKGATAEDVKLMKANISENMKVKASAGIRSYEDAVKMIEAGAERIGTSAGIKIVAGKI